MPRLRFVSTVEGADTIELQEAIITIGRGVNNVICIEDANISKHHVLLVMEDNAYRIFDLHSVNGTMVNGKRIGTATLQAGDAVRIGYLDLIYETATQAPTKPVAPETPVTPTISTPSPPPAPSAPVASVVPEPAVPVVATPTLPEPATTSAETTTKRPLLVFGKRAPEPEPTVPVVAEPTTPTPAPVVTPEPQSAPVKETPVTPPVSHKKFGAPPGGQNLKFRLKRD